MSFGDTLPVIFHTNNMPKGLDAFNQPHNLNMRYWLRSNSPNLFFNKAQVIAPHHNSLKLTSKYTHFPRYLYGNQSRFRNWRHCFGNAGATLMSLERLLYLKC